VSAKMYWVVIGQTVAVADRRALSTQTRLESSIPTIRTGRKIFLCFMFFLRGVCFCKGY
jgi:hypothetical protein